MKREQNNGHREGKVLITPSTGIALCFGFLCCFNITLETGSGGGGGGGGSIIGGNALSAVKKCRKELQILESSGRALDQTFF